MVSTTMDNHLNVYDMTSPLSGNVKATKAIRHDNHVSTLNSDVYLLYIYKPLLYKLFDFYID